jgi:hypothetical protein
MAAPGRSAMIPAPRSRPRLIATAAATSEAVAAADKPNGHHRSSTYDLSSVAHPNGENHGRTLSPMSPTARIR